MLSPVYADTVLSVFRTPPGSKGDLDWALEIEGPRAAIDVVVIDARGAAPVPLR